MTHASSTTYRGPAIACVILAAAIGAASAAPPLSVEDCVERVLASGESAAMGAARTAAAEARLAFAKRQYLPSLALSGSYTHSSEVEPGELSVDLGALGTRTIVLSEARQDAWLFRLGLQQPVFTGFRIESAVRQAEAGLDAARADEASTRRNAASAAEKAWWSLFLAQESVAVFEESAEAQRAHVEEARDRLGSGAGLKAELLSAKMREADLDAMVSEARAARDIARARLNLLIGLPWDEPIELAAPPAPSLVESPGDPSELAARARAARPELAAAAARVAAQEAALATAKAPLFPSVFLTGSYSLADPNPKAFPQRDGFEPLWDIGLLVSLDVGRVPAALAQADEARSGLAQSRLALEQAEDAVTLDVVSASLELSKSADRLKATESSVELAEEALRSQRDRLAAGLALPSDVTDAENGVLKARMERTRSRVSWELARIALRDAVGE